MGARAHRAPHDALWRARRSPGIVCRVDYIDHRGRRARAALSGMFSRTRGGVARIGLVDTEVQALAKARHGAVEDATIAISSTA